VSRSKSFGATETAVAFREVGQPAETKVIAKTRLVPFLAIPDLKLNTPIPLFVLNCAWTCARPPELEGRLLSV